MNDQFSKILAYCVIKHIKLPFCDDSERVTGYYITSE